MDEARTQSIAHRSAQFLVSTLNKENSLSLPANRKSTLNITMVITGVITAVITASIGTQAWANSTQCTNGGLTRSIEVVYSDPGQSVPCEVIYNKSAEGAGQHSLWRAGSEAGYCEAQAAAFADKLRDLGWNCDSAASGTSGASGESEGEAAEERLGELLDDAPVSEG
jgi:hypothetical protein